ncbi:MAG TPA: COX15/CtaA family protein, partial [Planctomycetota bacterium]|nr:COX15/CtaA family protein [Planctomycetota bacterium]
VLMVAIGGTTRLTGSGLSMTTWHPLMGAIPPMGDQEWDRVFGLYKETPQYAQVNHWMRLSDFKRIFFWEYVHRLMGRLIGLVFFVPWAYFVLRGRLRGRAGLLTFVAFVLGGLQGLLGWYMVKSGLVDEPRVSHFRLAAHLLLAFLTAQYVLWLALTLGQARGNGARPPAASRAVVAFAVLLIVQITYGAFMAGLGAGAAALTFPTMNGTWTGGDIFPIESGAMAALDHPLTVHFLHRALALVLLVLGGSVAFRSWNDSTWPRHWEKLLSFVLLLQVVLGALTVLYGVALVPAVAHQVNGLLLLSTVTFGLAKRTRPGAKSGVAPAIRSPLG